MSMTEMATNYQEVKQGEANLAKWIKPDRKVIASRSLAGVGQCGSRSPLDAASGVPPRVLRSERDRLPEYPDDRVVTSA